MTSRPSNLPTNCSAIQPAQTNLLQALIVPFTRPCLIPSLPATYSSLPCFQYFSVCFVEPLFSHLPLGLIFPPFYSDAFGPEAPLREWADASSLDCLLFACRPDGSRSLPSFSLFLPSTRCWFSREPARLFPPFARLSGPSRHHRQAIVCWTFANCWLFLPIFPVRGVFSFNSASPSSIFSHTPPFLLVRYHQLSFFLCSIFPSPLPTWRSELSFLSSSV